MRTSSRLGPSIALAMGGLPACTDGSGAAARASTAVSPPAAASPPTAALPEEPRNSDGSLQRLPPGPPSRPPHTLVLDYYDFGPQALAGQLIGSEWWQWEAGGSWEIGDRFDVRVVVHRGITTQEVMAEYPTVKGQADYRYVSYDDAMAFFDEHIAEIEGEPSLVRLQRELIATRARVRQALAGGEPGVEP